MNPAAYRTFVNFQPWGLAFGGNTWDQNDPHGLYASGTAATASVVDSETKGSTSFYVNGNLSAFNTGGYSVQNTRTRLGGIIHSAVYKSSTNKTLIACDYSNGWPTSKVAFEHRRSVPNLQSIARSRSNRIGARAPFVRLPNRLTERLTRPLMLGITDKQMERL